MLSHLCLYKKALAVTKASWTVFTTLHFLRNLQMGKIGEEGYIAQGQNNLGTNTPTYWAH